MGRVERSALQPSITLPPVDHYECVERQRCVLQGPPYRSSLKRLTEKFLKRQIQNGSHDSIDDARAALELAQLKFK